MSLVETSGERLHLGWVLGCLAAVLLVVLAHLALMLAALRGLPTLTEHPRPPVIVELLAPAPVATSTRPRREAMPPAEKPATTPRPARKPGHMAAAQPATTPMREIQDAAQGVPERAATATPSVGAAPSTLASSAPGIAAAPPANSPAFPGSLGLPGVAQAGNGMAGGGGVSASGGGDAGASYSAPPSHELHYDSFVNGVQNQDGTIAWRFDGKHYQLVVSMPLPFVGTFSYTSEGGIDAYGLAPERYIEQRGRRSTEVSTFVRGPATPHAEFTRTAKTVPLPPGAQDRFSVIMQLAGLLRADPERYRAGVAQDFFVVDDDSGETWTMVMVGTETLVSAGQALEATHFTRAPRREGDRRRVDIWFARTLDGMPVRFVQTEPNGMQFEFLYRGEADAPSERVEDNTPFARP